MGDNDKSDLDILNDPAPKNDGKGINDLDEMDDDVDSEKIKAEKKIPVLDADDDDEAESTEEVDKDDEEEEDSTKETKDEDDEDEEYEVDPDKPRPSFKELKGEFPEVFKKFPGLREALGREREFSKVFSTVEDAARVADLSEGYRNLEKQVENGNIIPILEALKSVEKPEAIEKIADNVLPNLYKFDAKLYQRAVTPVIYNTLKYISEKGKSIGGDAGENQQKAVRVIARFLFDDPELKNAPQPKAGPTEEELKLKKDKADFENTRYGTFVEELDGRAERKMTKVVEKTLEGTEGLTDYTKKKLITDIIEETNQLMKRDPEHFKKMQGLLRKVKEGDYSEGSKAQLITALLSRFNSLLPAIRRRLLAEATGNKVKNIKTTTEKKQIPASSGGGGKGKTTLTPEKAKSMSNLDILKMP